MSLVLEALEKVQRQGQAREKPQENIVKTLPLTKPRQSHKLLIFNMILFVAIINLLFLRWWLNRNSADISVNPVRGFDSNGVYIPAVTTSPMPKFDIIPKKAPPPSPLRLEVTGIVWDEREPIVLVNGKFLKKGEEILGARVIDIQPNEARFLRGNEELSFSVE